MTITGIVEKVQYISNDDNKKCVLTVAPGPKERAFIDFKGKAMNHVRGIKEGDVVIVEFAMEGRTNKETGRGFNNLTGKYLQRK